MAHRQGKYCIRRNAWKKIKGDVPQFFLVKERIIPESQGDNDIIAGPFSNQYGSLFFDRQPELFEGMNEFKIKHHNNGPLIQVSQRCHDGISKIRYGFRPKL